VPDRVNSLAPAVKQGSEGAIRETADLLLQSGGVEPSIAAAFGFRERIVQAEIHFRQHRHRGTTEAVLAAALNDLADRLELPLYARTSPAEVRRLRIRLLPLFPKLMVSEADGKALDEEMSPLEALFIASAMALQKFSNPDFQLSPSEWRGKRHQAKPPADISNRSGEIYHALVRGSSGLSLRDLLLEADALMDRLGFASWDAEVQP
jgi:hypothetical protein